MSEGARPLPLLCYYSFLHTYSLLLLGQGCRSAVCEHIDVVPELQLPAKLLARRRMGCLFRGGASCEALAPTYYIRYITTLHSTAVGCCIDSCESWPPSAVFRAVGCYHLDVHIVLQEDTSFTVSSTKFVVAIPQIDRSLATCLLLLHENHAGVS